MSEINQPSRGLNIRPIQRCPSCGAGNTEMQFQLFLRQKNVALSEAQWNVALAVLELERRQDSTRRFLRSRASGKTFLFQLLDEFFGRERP